MNWYENYTVAINRCTEYKCDKIKEIIALQFEKLGLQSDFFNGKNVVIKPNLVSGIKPEAACTTHPAVIKAVALLIDQYGGKCTLAESPGGLYTDGILKSLYSVTGMQSVADSTKLVLNYDTSYSSFSAPKGVSSRFFEIINPILNADIIIDVCKLKTHTLTLMSGAAKNLFGTIPGTFKAEQHARYSDQTDFQSALVDLAQSLFDYKPIICITDAIVGMEGNGPTGGTPKQIGYIYSSLNPFISDCIGCDILGFTENGVVKPNVKMIKFAAERKLCTNVISEINVIGDYTAVSDLIMPDTNLKKWFDVIPKWLSPRPKINTSKCRKCGRCAKVCPPKAIDMSSGKPVINKKICIHCFCCQELCPFKAVDIHKNVIFKIIK